MGAQEYRPRQLGGNVGIFEGVPPLLYNKSETSVPDNSLTILRQLGLSETQIRIYINKWAAGFGFAPETIVAKAGATTRGA